jgi:hypothetical protein
MRKFCNISFDVFRRFPTPIGYFVRINNR